MALALPDLLCLSPADAKKASQPQGKSSSEVFRRYLDNPSVQPEEFRPRSAHLKATSAASSTVTVPPQKSSATSWSSAPSDATLTAASAGSVWSSSVSASRQQSSEAGVTRSSSAAVGGVPPGLSRKLAPHSVDMPLGTSPPSVYSHASIEKLAMETAISEQSANPPNALSMDHPNSAWDATAFITKVRSTTYSNQSSMEDVAPAPTNQLPTLNLEETLWPSGGGGSSSNLLFGDNASDAGSSNSPAWDSPSEPGSFDALAASAQAFQKQRFDSPRLPVPRSSAPVSTRTNSSVNSSTRSSTASTSQLPSNPFGKYAYGSADLSTPSSSLDPWTDAASKSSTSESADALEVS